MNNILWSRMFARLRLLVALVALLTPGAQGRFSLPGRRSRGGALDGSGEAVDLGGISSATVDDPPSSEARLQLDRESLRRSLQLARSRPLSTVGAYVLMRLFVAHVRIQTGKRRKLRALRRQMAGGGRLHVTIVTTAALPWKTGTSVNALLRAAYVADAGHDVTLCVPWIHLSEQVAIFPHTFGTPAEQEAFMRAWLQERDGSHAGFAIRFYPARYDVVRGSILPLGDTTRYIGEHRARNDVCVLEEPGTARASHCTRHAQHAHAHGNQSSKRPHGSNSYLDAPNPSLPKRTSLARRPHPPQTSPEGPLCCGRWMWARGAHRAPQLVPWWAQLAAAVQAGSRRGAHQLHLVRDAVPTRERLCGALDQQPRVPSVLRRRRQTE